MCILLYTSAHPDYPHILLNNRDEFLTRPTAHATWWAPPHSHILGGRDLQRDVQGTWLGITRQGRVAVLTNFREEGQIVVSERSRGELPKMFLGAHVAPEEWAKGMVEGKGVQGVGGFSLVFGLLRGGGSGGGHENGENGVGTRSKLGVVSNRMKEAKEVKWLKDQTWGLSNAIYGDRTWPKVVQGEELLDQAVKESTDKEESAEDLIERCFDILSTDTLPKWKAGDEFQTFVRELRNSIFIPAIGGRVAKAPPKADELAAAKEDGPTKADQSRYGTQRQTVILVDKKGRVTFVERALYDGEGQPLLGKGRDVKVEFDIEGWS